MQIWAVFSQAGGAEQSGNRGGVRRKSSPSYQLITLASLPLTKWSSLPIASAEQFAMVPPQTQGWEQTLNSVPGQRSAFSTSQDEGQEIIDRSQFFLPLCDLWGLGGQAWYCVYLLAGQSDVTEA